MTERKPGRLSFESWVDKQIREATERGEFDDLPGSGKPLPSLRDQDDPLWWVKGYLRREELSTEAVLPESLRLRKEIERLPDTILDLRSEQAVREVVADLNRRIAAWLRAPSGPQVHLAPVNAADVLARWHEGQQAAEVEEPEPDHDVSPRPRRWWQRFHRR